MLSFYNTDLGIQSYISLCGNNCIPSVFDTGCDRTAMNIKALITLSGKSAVDVIMALKLGLSTKNTQKVTLADGLCHTCLYVRLNNVQVGEMLFPIFNVRIDCDCLLNPGMSDSLLSSIWDTSEVVLIGMDIIRSFAITELSLERTACYEFSLDKYASFWKIPSSEFLNLGDCSPIETFSRIKERMASKDINTSNSNIMKFCSTLPDNFLNQELSNNDLDRMISMYVANLSDKKG